MKEGNAEEKYVRILYPDELSALDKRVIGEANVSVLRAIEQTSAPEKKLTLDDDKSNTTFSILKPLT